MIIKIYTFNCKKVNHCLLAYEFNRILKALPSPRKPYTLLRSGGAPLLTSCLLTLLSLFLPRADQLQFSAFQTTCCVHSRETWQAPCGFSGHPSIPTWPMLFTWFLPSSFSASHQTSPGSCLHFSCTAMQNPHSSSWWTSNHLYRELITLKETTSNIACSLQQTPQPKGTGPCQEQQIKTHLRI